MTTTYDEARDAAGSMNGHADNALTDGGPPRPRKQRRKTPALHTDAHMGPLVLNEALNTLESLQGELASLPPGAARRALESREWVQRLWVEELEAYHGDDGGDV